MTSKELLLIAMAAALFWIVYHERKWQEGVSSVISTNFVIGKGDLQITQWQWWELYLYQQGVLPKSKLPSVNQIFLQNLYPKQDNPFASLESTKPNPLTMIPFV